MVCERIRRRSPVRADPGEKCEQKNKNARADEGRPPFRAAVSRRSRDSPYKRGGARRNARAALVQVRVVFRSFDENKNGSVVSF